MKYDELLELVEQHDKLEQKILQSLPDGDECRCKGEYDCFDYIHYGNWCEIMRVCLNCGGIKEIRE